MAENVRDKEKNNRCEYFTPGEVKIESVSKNKALEDLAKLFK